MGTRSTHALILTTTTSRRQEFEIIHDFSRLPEQFDD